MTIQQKKDQLVKSIHTAREAIRKWHADGCPDGFEPSASAIIGMEDLVKKLDVAMTMTEDEVARLKAIPSYSDDFRAVKDIKDNYGFSWNELKMIAGLDF